MVSEVFRSSDDYIQRQLEKVASEGNTDEPKKKKVRPVQRYKSGSFKAFKAVA